VETVTVLFTDEFSCDCNGFFDGLDCVIHRFYSFGLSTTDWVRGDCLPAPLFFCRVIGMEGEQSNLAVIFFKTSSHDLAADGTGRTVPELR
jgi:hypothetical protein